MNVASLHDKELVEGELIEANDRGLVFHMVQVFDFSDEPEVEHAGEVESIMQFFVPWEQVRFVQWTIGVRPLHEDQV